MRQGNGDVNDGLCPEPGNSGAPNMFNGERNAIERLSDQSALLFAQTRPRRVVRAKIHVALSETDGSTRWLEGMRLARS